MVLLLSIDCGIQNLLPQVSVNTQGFIHSYFSLLPAFPPPKASVYFTLHQSRLDTQSLNRFTCKRALMSDSLGFITLSEESQRGHCIAQCGLSYSFISCIFVPILSLLSQPPRTPDSLLFVKKKATSSLSETLISPDCLKAGTWRMMRVLRLTN